MGFRPVRIGTTDATSVQDLTPTLDRSLGDLVRAGNLELATSLPGEATIDWPG